MPQIRKLDCVERKKMKEKERTGLTFNLEVKKQFKSTYIAT